MKIHLFAATALLLLAACEEREATLSEDRLRADIAMLASDAFEGRGPASVGEEKTIAFLEQRFRNLGLEPGFGDSYLQPVPLVSMTVSEEADAFRAEAGTGEEMTPLAFGSEIVAWSKREVGAVSVADRPVVFVGYGIVAPEYGWNDYRDVDVRGKTVLMFVNDPGYATGDPALFKGRTMTYYGRWTYKFEEAARQGAAAAILIHEDGPAGYPWDVVRSSWTGEQFSLVAEDGGAARAAIEAWVTGAVGERLLAGGGIGSIGEARALALSGTFGGRETPVRFSAALEMTLSRTVSHNVMAVRKGARRPEELVLYLAHWDHLGHKKNADGDGIYNGALDNASGTAGLLELARVFAAGEAPERSVGFLAVTAEEQGLLGSAFYAQTPAFPVERTVAAINMDGLNILGPMADIVLIGEGQNDLEDYLVTAAGEQERRVEPEDTPEHGYFYRSDHFSLAKVGIPALYTDSGTESREHGKDWVREARETYIREHYHKPSDEYSPEWDLSGAIEDLELFRKIGERIADSDDWPEWKDGSEFKAIRARSLGQGQDQ
ncbi:MAG: M28 family metallopeptidase [Rhodothalassiaceae bacterium]